MSSLKVNKTGATVKLNQTPSNFKNFFNYPFLSLLNELNLEHGSLTIRHLRLSTQTSSRNLTLNQFEVMLMRAQGVPDLFQDYRISRHLHKCYIKVSSSQYCVDFFCPYI